jgi:hypothetical protein
MLKGPLRFAIVVEPEFVHRAVIYRPRVTNVVLLKTFFRDRAETWHIRPCRLELRERRNHMMVVEVIVEAKILMIVQSVIDFHRELISTGWLDGRCDDYATAI